MDHSARYKEPARTLTFLDMKKLMSMWRGEEDVELTMQEPEDE